MGADLWLLGDHLWGFRMATGAFCGKIFGPLRLSSSLSVFFRPPVGFRWTLSILVPLLLVGGLDLDYYFRCFRFLPRVLLGLRGSA